MNSGIKNVKQLGKCLMNERWLNFSKEALWHFYLLSALPRPYSPEKQRQLWGWKPTFLVQLTGSQEANTDPVLNTVAVCFDLSGRSLKDWCRGWPLFHILIPARVAFQASAKRLKTYISRQRKEDRASSRHSQKAEKAENEVEISWGHKGSDGPQRTPGETECKMHAQNQTHA